MHKKINAILIPVIIIVLAVLLFVLPQRTFSERENRMLTAFPKLSISSISSGEFTENFEDFACDHFPLRDMWIGLNTRIKLVTGQKEVNGVYFADDDYLIEKYEESDYLKKIAGIINSFEEKVDADVTFMAVPTSSVINREKLPEGSDCPDQQKDMELFCSKLNCPNVDLLDILVAVNEKTPAFYRLDHHWTAAAAKEAFRSYYFTGDADNTLETENLKTVSYTFRGTLFNKVGECGLGYDTIQALDLSDYDIVYETEEGYFDSIYDESKLEGADKYAYFLSGNHPVATITNKSNEDVLSASGETLVHYDDIVIIKDSYANCMIPFMVPYYHTITVIDPRYYGGSISALINELGAEHVLFVYNMNSIGTDLGIRRVR